MPRPFTTDYKTDSVGLCSPFKKAWRLNRLPLLWLTIVPDVSSGRTADAIVGHERASKPDQEPGDAQLLLGCDSLDGTDWSGPGGENEYSLCDLVAVGFPNIDLA